MAHLDQKTDFMLTEMLMRAMVMGTNLRNVWDIASQNLHPISNTFKYFLQCLLSLECFNNLQTLVCVSSESFQCSFMVSTPDFCLKLVCPYSAHLCTVACPEDFHPFWSCLSSPPLPKCTESNYLPDFPGCLVTLSIASTS